MEFLKRDKHPALDLLLFLAFFISFLFIAQFLALVVLYPFIGNQAMNLGNIINNPVPYPEYRGIILFLQGFTSFIAMIICPLIFVKAVNSEKLTIWNNATPEIFYFSTALIVIVAMPFIALVADWNMSISLPNSLNSIQQWAAEKESQLKILTEYITSFESNNGFFVGLVVIAVIPAVGEELIFRGIFQNYFVDWFRNKHMAIWLAAFIFSAIHVQFFGFFPRMFLGALFGYLYIWTGSLLIPITAHFANNGFTLFLIHMKNQNKLQMDLETTKEMPLNLIIGSGVLTLIMIVLFYVQLKKGK
jgi:hypothetical protein